MGGDSSQNTVNTHTHIYADIQGKAIHSNNSDVAFPSSVVPRIFFSKTDGPILHARCVEPIPLIRPRGCARGLAHRHDSVTEQFHKASGRKTCPQCPLVQPKCCLSQWDGSNSFGMTAHQKQYNYSQRSEHIFYSVCLSATFSLSFCVPLNS